MAEIDGRWHSTVPAASSGDWHHVHLDEELAHEHDAAVDLLVHDIRHAVGVVEAHREDREVLIVTGAGLDAQVLHDLVGRLLERRLSGP